MSRTGYLSIFLVLSGLLLAACKAQPEPTISYDPASLRFSGQRALEIEGEFVARFPNRHSGQANNRLAAEWLRDRFTELGWSCTIDSWEIVNYSRPVPLNNVVCRLPGASQKEILVLAHLDQAPTTVQGADNNGSGVAILLHLAEIFAVEQDRPYSLAFVATDAEEYGMIGTQRFVETHPDPSHIIAGVSLDNLGRTYYDGMDVALVGQYRSYSPAWLALTTRASARSAGLPWQVSLRAPLDQVTDQAAPISLTDQGPLVAAGVPALGFGGHVPAQSSELHYQLWHDPADTLEHQSAGSLQQSGLIVEALIRQLLGMESFPQESGPYLYFDDTRQILTGAPLSAIFISFVGLFLVGSLWAGGRRPLRERLGGWWNAMPHFLGLWLPLLAAIVLLYGLVAAGLMNAYHSYPATTKDPDLLHPRLPAVILFVVGIALFLFLGRYFVRKYASRQAGPRPEAIKGLALFIVAVGGVYVLAINPFSLLFFVPLLFWLLIRGRQGFWKGLDILFFLLGGLVVYALVYFFGFLILRYNFAFLWYMMNMFAVRMIGFPTAAMITAIVAAGLSMIVTPPRRSQVVE